jgi:hypothetical protein
MWSLYDELCCRTINAARALRIQHLLLGVWISATAALTGCALHARVQPPDVAMPAPTLMTPTQTREPVTPAPNINPLTGLPLEDPALLNRPPIIVKISNAPPLVRPQAGLGAADLVYEHYVEGGLTRFSAVFWSQAPSRVGSIRSARLIDDALTAMYQGLLAYSGASDGVQRVINDSDIAPRSFLAPVPYFYRDTSLAAPHNLFVDVGALYQLAARQGYAQRPSLAGMYFDPQRPAGAAGAASLVEIAYRATRAGWVYDAGQGAYLRFSDGQPHLDAGTGAQVQAENVVILYARHRETDIVESVWQDVVSYSLEIALWGEGDAVLLRDGERYDVRWERTMRDQPLMLITIDGQLIPLKPGVTWFQVFPPPEAQRPGEERVAIR